MDGITVYEIVLLTLRNDNSDWVFIIWFISTIRQQVNKHERNCCSQFAVLIIEANNNGTFVWGDVIEASK